jgi:hypothetical protein
MATQNRSPVSGSTLKAIREQRKQEKRRAKVLRKLARSEAKAGVNLAQ